MPSRSYPEIRTAAGIVVPNYFGKHGFTHETVIECVPLGGYHVYSDPFVEAETMRCSIEHLRLYLLTYAFAYRGAKMQPNDPGITMYQMSTVTNATTLRYFQQKVMFSLIHAILESPVI